MLGLRAITNRYICPSWKEDLKSFDVLYISTAIHRTVWHNKFMLGLRAITNRYICHEQTEEFFYVGFHLCLKIYCCKTSKQAKNK